MQKNTKTGSTPPLRQIKTQEALCELSEQLSQHNLIAVDTESNSLYAYRERVCLIQISVPGINYLVDPLALDDLSPLGPVLASNEIEKVFHAADYDLMVLRRDFGFECTNLFDTMWAARILGWPHVGLGDILKKYFDVKPNKRYQRYNWGKRPLDADALAYAWTDTYYLLGLREIQRKELLRLKRLQEAEEVFTYLCETVHNFNHPDPDERFWRIKGIHRLKHHEQQVLYRLHCWREQMAEKLDRPTVKVISNRRLVKLAQIQPRSKAELFTVGISPYQIRRFGKMILKALSSPTIPMPAPPKHHERPPAPVMNRYGALKSWRKDIAYNRGVDSDVILPNAVLWEIAWNPPETLDDLSDISGIGPWRCAHYGPDLLQLVKE